MNDSAPQKVSLEWQPPTGMFGLSLSIFFLRLLTLGIYHFWGKTEVRRKLWSSVHVQGQPLEYTGTGKELFIGFLVVFFLVLLPLYAVLFGVQFYFGPKHWANGVAAIVFIVVFLFLFGMAQYRARRYRLSRTTWRGIRSSMSGTASGYAWTYFWTALLIPLTLGWIIPWRDVKLQRHLVNDTQLGDSNLLFEAGARQLYGPFALLWIGTIALYAGASVVIALLFGKQLMLASALKLPPPLYVYLGIIAILIVALLLFGIISAWYNARKYNLFARSTRLQNAVFKLNATASSLIGLTIGNMLLTFLTLGIALPIVQARLSRYFVKRMEIDGFLGLQEITQNKRYLDRIGEGLAEAFDIDAF